MDEISLSDKIFMSGHIGSVDSEFDNARQTRNSLLTTIPEGVRCR